MEDDSSVEKAKLTLWVRPGGRFGLIRGSPIEGSEAKNSMAYIVPV